MLKLLATAGLFAGLAVMTASAVVFGMLMLAFSTDGVQNANKLPQGPIAAIALVGFGFLLYALVAPVVLFWQDATWRQILWPIKIGWGLAFVTFIVNFALIVRAAMPN